MREWAKLTREQRRLFLAGVEEMIEDLRGNRGFRPSLRVKAVQGHPGVYEMTWAEIGRATFTYGPEQRPHQPHVVWRRIGGHDILKDP